MQSQERSKAPSKYIDFDSYTKKVRKIYDKYSSSSSAIEYKNSGSAIEEIKALVKKIEGQVRHVSFSRKVSALEAIVDISMWMLESERGTLAHEIRKNYYFPGLGYTVGRIIDRLPRKELLLLQDNGSLIDDIDRCNAIADEDYALHMGLEGVIDKLTNELSDEEDEEDSEQDGALVHDAGGSSLRSLVEKTTAVTPRVGSWLESLEPTAAA